MKKRILTFAAALMLLTSATAVPARRTKMKVMQPDGTILTIMRVGDENNHFTCTADGLPVVKRSDGVYCYARMTENGSLVATAQVAHEKGIRTQSETAFLQAYETDASVIRNAGAKRMAERNALRMQRMEKRNTAMNSGNVMRSTTSGAGGGEGIGVTGKRKGLVILVNFKDKAMLSSHTNEEWKNYFNEVGYSKLGNSGSVHDYFSAQSYGQFDLEFDVVGPVTVSKNMASYGGNDSYGNDKDPGGMVYEACKLVDSQVNFADYDWDGDGEVDQVYLIYAGYGEASGDDDNPLSNTIWQHEWTLSAQNYSLNLDGVKIDTYGCSSELNGNTGSDMDGIGTACHEFSHCLGLPDIYDVNYKAFGMGDWDLMDYGSYGGDGYKPVGYNTYERWVSGWLQPTELKNPCFVNDFKALSDSPESYIIYNEKTPTEYYLLENRQKKGFDTEIPAEGMLVIHVDYDKQAWENNQVNTVKNHQRFTIVPADNKLTDDTEDGDTYPGKSGNTSLTDTSLPAATLFNANSDNRKFLGKPITDIAENNGLISFTFMNGIELNTPTDLTSTEITSTGFTASWSVEENAESYELQLKQKGDQTSPEESVLLAEDFTTLGKDFKGDGSTDISSKLDQYLQTPGWTGEKIFECKECIKIGSNKAVGKLVSPVVTTHTTENVTIALVSKTYGTDAAEATISLLDANGNEFASQTIVPDGTLATVTFANVEGNDYKVQVKPKKRGYVMSIGIYDGSFTADEFDGTSAVPNSVMSFGEIRKTADNTVKDINGITTTSYKFENLSEGASYRWRVRAVAGEINTSWSGWQTVSLGATSIDHVTSVLTGDAPVEVRSLSGMSFGKMTYSEFMNNPAFAGAYILSSGEANVKVMK